MTKQEKEIYELIERFINQDLSGEEQEAFHQRMKNEPDFAKEVNAHMEVHQILLDQGVLDIKQKLQKIHQSEKNNTNNRFNYFSGVAILIGIAVTAFILFQIQSPSPEENNTVSAVKMTERREFIKENVLAENTNEKEKINNSLKKGKKPLTQKNETNTFQNVDSFSVSKNVDSLKVAQPNTADNKPFDFVNKKTTTDTSVTDPGKNVAGTQVDCSSILIKGEVYSTESCTDEKTGSIAITLHSLKGGVKPYKFSITDKDEFTTASTFGNLSPGNYRVLVKDKNECVSVLQEVLVKGKDCRKEYIFTPAMGEVWSLPLKENANAELRIFSRNGALVYTSVISNGYPDNWNGDDYSGQALPMGSYSFMIVYDKEVVQGFVTIMR